MDCRLRRGSPVKIRGTVHSAFFRSILNVFVAEFWFRLLETVGTSEARRVRFPPPAKWMTVARTPGGIKDVNLRGKAKSRHAARSVVADPWAFLRGRVLKTLITKKKKCRLYT